MESQNGYIGLTDPDWYAYLSAHPHVDEVNFWQPHGNRVFRAIKPGEPFFFKLRAPLKAIAGFGFFERFETLPAWLAWECFGEMNGAPDFESMIDRIIRLRGDGGSRSGDFKIGCIMVTAPVFFAKMSGLRRRRLGRDRHPTGQDVRARPGEGHRVFRECMERANPRRSLLERRPCRGRRSTLRRTVARSPPTWAGAFQPRGPRCLPRCVRRHRRTLRAGP